ncbi:uncharacterized protein C5L36_0B12125 [Pichia kudriavzevii]|uniref:Uncharacterized protein n=2 Tax=Pichia kudriavzevii TaxID=4909 RepID=A0A2U9R3X1_PICKU|nr:uncharacterized protein C5L36_0B12125 [Pichia kudriavzevii]AWU75983.1 hypothetical protein C5L36_0B12125 [Pichia kudriavzevii]
MYHYQFYRCRLYAAQKLYTFIFNTLLTALSFDLSCLQDKTHSMDTGDQTHKTDQVRINPESILACPPKPVSLPYDLPALPSKHEVAAQMKHLETQLIPRLSAFVDLPLREPANDSLPVYQRWKQEVQRLNPGLTSISNIMAPTKKNT